MYAGCILLIVVSVPTFLLIVQGGYAAIFFRTLPMGRILVCFMSTEPSTLPALFPTSVRNGATATSYNLSVSAFGGTTPLIAGALVKVTGDLLVPAYILIVAGMVGIVAVYFLPEPAGNALKGSTPTAASEEEARDIAANTLSFD